MSVYVVLMGNGAIYSIHKSYSKAYKELFKIKRLYEDATVQKFNVE